MRNHTRAIARIKLKYGTDRIQTLESQRILVHCFYVPRLISADVSFVRGDTTVVKVHFPGVMGWSDSFKVRNGVVDHYSIEVWAARTNTSGAIMYDHCISPP